MPPTMIETFGVADASSSAAAPRQPVRAAATEAVAIEAARTRRGVVRMGVLLGVGTEMGMRSEVAGELGAGRRAPRGEALLEPGDEPLGAEGEDGDDQHAGVDACGVE